MTLDPSTRAACEALAAVTAEALRAQGVDLYVPGPSEPQLAGTSDQPGSDGNGAAGPVQEALNSGGLVSLPPRTGEGTEAGAVTLVARALQGARGEPIGVLVARWPTPHHLAVEDEQALQSAASAAVRLLELDERARSSAQVIDLMPNAVALLDPDGSIRQANAAFEELLGDGEVLDLEGRVFIDLVAPHHRVRVATELARLLVGRRERSRSTCELVAADGRNVPCSLHAARHGDRLDRLQVTVQDLTEQQVVAERHSQLSEQLARAQRLDAVSQVAGGLAHDLNNLIAVMTSNLGMAKESLAEAPPTSTAAQEAFEDLGELERAVERAGALTNQLLSLSRDQDGVEGTADVPEVLASLQALVGRTLPPDVRFEVCGPEELPELAVDPIQLERTLLNLVINARDAVEERGGTIRLEVERRRKAVSTPREVGAGGDGRTTQPRDGVCIVVRDDGCGMDERTRARAFDPLFTTKRDRGGSGLGLATVLAFVEQADGDIELRSTRGEGTEVQLWLPSTVSEPAAVSVGGDVPVAGARIVLVDPGERTRRIITEMLVGAGYRVTAVASAEAALEAVEREQPDLLITELTLPSMQAARLLDLAAELPATPRLLALASVSQPSAIHGTPVLVKPFSHARLLRTVSEVLQDL